MSKEDRIEFLEQERVKIWERLTDLEVMLQKRTPDYEEEAKAASAQAINLKNSIEEAKAQAIVNLDEIAGKLNEIKGLHETGKQLSAEVEQYSSNAKAKNDGLNSIYDDSNAKAKIILEQSNDIQKIIEGKPLLDEKLTRLEEVFVKGDDYDTKLGALHKSINDRKKEIDELYYQIIGYTDKSENEEEIRVKGIKDQLQESFNSFDAAIKVNTNELFALKEDVTNKYELFANEKESEFSTSMAKWIEGYNGVRTKLGELLPNALTTGLSYAYSEKKQTEENENKTYLKTFNKAIVGLVLVSLIPFLISIVFIVQGESLQAVILRVPRIVLAILPLYLPILWVAYSTNRKMNLAKRLIEEYSHKEVLSKTFEGLSKQIDSISDKGISSDLRIRLLYNILEVNSENPGKLISDYNKSDHPLMDALEKSTKLNNAISRIEKIPGLSKLLTILQAKESQLIKETQTKVSVGLEAAKLNK